MQTKNYTDLEGAILGAKKMQEERPFDVDTFLIVPEVYETADGFLVAFAESTTEKRDNLGTLLGYVDGRFRPVEEVRAEVERDQQMEF